MSAASRLRATGIAGTVLLLGACATAPVAPMPTVAAVDLDRYLGTWHEIALIPNRFQAQCAGDTQAEYLREDDTLRVINRCRQSDGTPESARGVAEVVDGSNNAKLRVSFFRPFYGDYWVLALDPDYRRVLVGEPGRRYGWILSRTPVMAEAEVAALLDRAEALGYDRRTFAPSPRLAETWQCGDTLLRTTLTPTDELMLELGGERRRLRAVPAASGTRYADENFVFWMKGDEARVERAGQPLHADCRRMLAQGS